MLTYKWPDEQLVPEKVAAEFLSLSPRTLRNWRVLGKGPEFVRISNRCIRYRFGTLKRFAERRTLAHTTEARLE